MRRHRLVGALAAAGVLVLSGCASASSQEPVAPTPEVDDGAEALASILDPCAKLNLTTVEPGAFTFATTAVPAPPFFLTDDPSDRVGLEADFAYTLAEELGFRPGEVTWEFIPAEQILSGQFIDYDVAIGGFVADERSGASVMFSKPYLQVDFADVNSMAMLTPTVGDESTSGVGEQGSIVDYSLALVSGNPLVPCVDRALDEMSELGTLDALRARWLDPQQLPSD